MTKNNKGRSGGDRPKNENGRQGVIARGSRESTFQGDEKQGQFSTATLAQHARLLELLRVKPRTTAELRERHGIMHPGGRVMELREAGYDIATLREWLDNPPYRHKKVARYVLLREAGHALPVPLICLAAFLVGALLSLWGAV